MPRMRDLTPQQIVDELDRYVIGQHDAKRAVAVAIRNRWRRRALPDDMAKEVAPKNIVMAGPTGVGKTEIARRLAKLVDAPFIKVEASKFTEVGYHGRDVESMVRDLVDRAVTLVRVEQSERVKEKAKDAVDDRLLALLLPDQRRDQAGMYTATGESGEARQRLTESLRKKLNDGELEDKTVELTVRKRPPTKVMFANMGLEQMDPDMADMFEKLVPEKNVTRRVTIAEARRIITEEETEKLLDPDAIAAEAVDRASNDGIIFLDEIDKIATPGSGDKGGGKSGGGPDVSRQGVQRDLLPIVEGSAVTTRYGVVHTDHILFVAAGAFHVASPGDLMPELQGRFPIRVELQALTKDDFKRILTEPKNALTTQQQMLLGVEGLTVEFEDGAIDAIAELAARANQSLENIGARRLMTIIEKVFEQVNFDAPQRVAASDTTLHVTADYVREQVAGIVDDPDLSHFVL